MPRCPSAVRVKRPPSFIRARRRYPPQRTRTARTTTAEALRESGEGDVEEFDGVGARGGGRGLVAGGDVD